MSVVNGPDPTENDGKIFELHVANGPPAGSPPVAVADSASTAEGAQVVINVAANDSDPDGNLDLSGVTITAPPASGATATPNGNGTVTYTPPAGFTGNDNFTYRICDTTNLCATATATITVTSGDVFRYHVSLSSKATVPGIAGTMQDEDIIVFDGAARTWAMFFDGSDVGVGTGDVNAFHLRADGTVLMSLDNAMSIPGLIGGPDGTLVDDSDIILFTPTSTGVNTTGTFRFFLDGSEVGLTENGEDIDGLFELPDGSLAISTVGTINVPGLTGADEDILLFSANDYRCHHHGHVDHHLLRRLRPRPHHLRRRPRCHQLRLQRPPPLLHRRRQHHRHQRRGREPLHGQLRPEHDRDHHTRDRARHRRDPG